jgi:hypothetical protein
MSSTNINNSNNIKDLDPIERKILSAIRCYGGSIDKRELISFVNKISPDQIHRGLEWLKFKKRITIENNDISILEKEKVV